MLLCRVLSKAPSMPVKAAIVDCLFAKADSSVLPFDFAICMLLQMKWKVLENPIP